MFGFIYGYFWGYICGFISNYIYRLISKYYEYNNVKKVVINNIYNIISAKVFDILYDEIDKNNSDFKINGLEDFHDIGLLIKSLEYMIKNHNNKFKLSFVDNKFKIKLLDQAYINDAHFVRVCEFFTKNNIDLNIIVCNTNINKLE